MNSTATAPQIHLTGNPPDRHGWKITLDGVPMASSTRQNMTADAAKEHARAVLDRMMRNEIGQAAGK